jgi:hypothetical protein
MNLKEAVSEVITAMDLSKIEVSPVKTFERGRWRYLMNKYHYLGFKKTGGEQVLYVAEADSEWIALIGWSTGVFKNKSRDSWINWDESLRIKRLKYIANNFRFLIFPWIRVKNLATRVLSLNLKRLSSDWEDFYGHEIIMAETFVDTNRFFGTCYKASNWIALGETMGYGRNNGRYYYHGIKKRIFIYPMIKDASKILSESLIEDSKEEEKMGRDWKKLNLKERTGLFEVLAAVPDPRKDRGKRHPLRLILSISVCAALSGAKGFTGIAQWAKTLTKKQLKKLGSWRKEVPSLTCIREVLLKIEADRFDKIIYNWLIENNLVGMKALAVDGKTLRGSHDGEKKAIHLLSAILHEEKIIIAQKEVGDKTNEIPELRKLLKPIDIEGSVVTADAMHTQAETARFIVKDKKADYLFTVKDNQEKLRNSLESLNYEAFSP